MAGVNWRAAAHLTSFGGAWRPLLHGELELAEGTRDQENRLAVKQRVFTAKDSEGRRILDHHHVKHIIRQSGGILAVPLEDKLRQDAADSMFPRMGH